MKKEENNLDTIKDFIGIFPNAVSKEYCNEVINHFQFVQKTRGGGLGNIVTRQDHGAPRMMKDSDMYFFENELDPIVLEDTSLILQEYNAATWKCYTKLREKYGILETLSQHQMSHSVKIQKYEPSQGYHVWHCDTDNMITSRRMLVVTLYLNTVEEGGETEFLYQSMRMPAVQGTLVLFPTGWTHAHRGNPPLKGNKYIMNTWLEFMK